MTRTMRIVLAAFATAVALLPMQGAFAQGRYPERPIKLIIPVPARRSFQFSGPSARGQAEESFSETLSSRTSAALPADAAQKSPPGQSLTATPYFSPETDRTSVAPLAASKLSYDPVKDFEPISLIGTTGMAIAVHPSQPFKTLAEIIDFIQKNPGKLSFGSAGTGSMTGLSPVRCSSFWLPCPAWSTSLSLAARRK